MAERFRALNSSSDGFSHRSVGLNPGHDQDAQYYNYCSSLRGINRYLQGQRLILCLKKPWERHDSAGCKQLGELRNIKEMLLAQ